MADYHPLGEGIGGGTMMPQDPLSSPAAAASATLPSQEMTRQLAMQLVQQLIQNRHNAVGSGITFGAQPTAPRLPLPPIESSGGQIAQGPFASTGQRKRADAQATFNTIGDLVNKAEKRHYEMKVQKIQQNFDTLFGAIQGYNEAQSMGDQGAMQHNADVINRMLADPKVTKELQKAYDVNLNPMAQDKKKEKANPANDALKASFGKAQQAYSSKQTPLTPQAQMFMQAMPQRAQPDLRYQQYLEGLKAGAFPKAGEELTFTAKLGEIQQRINNNQVTNETKKDIAHMIVDATNQKTRMAAVGLLARLKNAKDIAGVVSEYHHYQADKMLEGVKARVEELKKRFASGGTGDKNLDKAIKSMDSQVKNLATQLAGATKSKDKKAVEDITKQLAALRTQQQILSLLAAQKAGADTEEFENPLNLSPDMTDKMLELFATEGITDGGESDTDPGADQ